MGFAGCTGGVGVAVFGSEGGLGVVGFGVVAVVACTLLSFVSTAFTGAAPGLGTEAAGDCGEGPDGFSFFPSACAAGRGALGAIRGREGCAASGRSFSTADAGALGTGLCDAGGGWGDGEAAACPFESAAARAWTSGRRSQSPDERKNRKTPL